MQYVRILVKTFLETAEIINRVGIDNSFVMSSVSMYFVAGIFIEVNMLTS